MSQEPSSRASGRPSRPEHAGSGACARVEPLLSAFEEGELAPDERELVLVHVAVCPACAAELCSEQSLSALLGPLPAHGSAPAPVLASAASPPVPKRVRTLRVLAAVGLAGVAFALVPLLIPKQPAYGQATLAPLPSLASASTAGAGLPLPASWAKRSDGSSWRLSASNHVTVPAGQTFHAVLDGVGSIGATGPAAFELENGGEGWKLVLLRGAVRADVGEDGELRLVTALLERTLGAGTHAVDAPDASSFEDPPADASPSELLERGHGAFFTRERFVEAEACYRRARDHAGATDEQRRDAHFYLVASLTRQEDHADAVVEGEAFLARYPDDKSVHYALLFHAGELRAVGREQDARAAWQRIVDEAPGTDLAELARGYLDEAAPRAGPERAPKSPKSSGGYVPDRLLPARGKPGGVAVLVLGLDPKLPDDARFLRVAEEAAGFHGTKVEALAPAASTFEHDLQTLLRASRPRSVLLFVPPRLLDVNLHRRVLLATTRLDGDLFPDCTFGWLTARDGKALEELWKRTQQVRKKGLSSKRIVQAFVMGKAESTLYAEYGSEIEKKAGFQPSGIGFGCIESDPKVLDFVERQLPALEKAGVIQFTGNGDPQGIWLFDDHRNIDRARHWEFDPARVGRDEDGTMPRILARQIAKLRLVSPIVWSGTCHSGAVRRVFVEGDIVSTFGRTDRTTLHELDPKESLALAFLDAGAVALLVPIAANHGYVVDMESEFALRNGATLGETIKSTWDDVLLQARGELELDFVVPGEPHASREPVMAGGGANRLLIGDPTLAPFTSTQHPTETVTIAKKGPEAFEVTVEWTQTHHTRFWDIFGTDRAQDARICARVALDDLVPDDLPRRVSATARVTDAKDGKELPFTLTHAEPEELHGRRYLHLQANASRKVYEDRALKAVFSITLAPVTVETR